MLLSNKKNIYKPSMSTFFSHPSMKNYLQVLTKMYFNFFHFQILNINKYKVANGIQFQLWGQKKKKTKTKTTFNFH